MKLRVFLFGVAIASCLAACQSVPEQDLVRPEFIENQLTAIIEPEEETRTSLSPQGNHRSSVLWSEGDEIGVFLDGASTAKTFTLSDGAGTKQGVFTGQGKAKDYVAFYPASMAPGLSGKTIRFSLPYEQTYEAGTFANGSYPMAAAGSSSELQFRNLSSVLKLSLTGHHSVTRIVFRSNDPSVKVAGQASVSMDNPDNPVLTMASNGVDSLVLQVSSVQLKQDEATDFYLSLPPQTYKKGFTVRIYTGERYMDKSLESDFTLVRSRMHAATAFEFVPNGVDVSARLEGKGTEDEPFLIQSLSDLLLLQEAMLVKGGTIASVDCIDVLAAQAYYLLTADIDLSPVCSEKLHKNWIPIGNGGNPFSGTFDGDGHLITNLYIQKGTWSQAQGFFGAINQSFIANLSVQGTLKGDLCLSGLIVGQSSEKSTIENCASFGFIESTLMVVGGIVGAVYNGYVKSCSNEANVQGSTSVGGIVGESYPYGVQIGVNHGTIKGDNNVGGIAGVAGGPSDALTNTGSIAGNEKVGGIIGLLNNDILSNCQNLGTVSAVGKVGGIAGYIHQSGQIVNSINRGSVTATEGYLGGICGEVNSELARQTSTSLLNCVNVGRVQVNAGGLSARYTGGIAGYLEGARDGYLPSRIEQCYWLNDREKGLGMEQGIGVNEGERTGNYGLTDAQMKGADCYHVLYSTNSGNAFFSIHSSLNAWAYDHHSGFDITLQGWSFPQEGEFLMLSGLQVQEPGQEGAFFSLTPNLFRLSAAASEVEVSVVSALEYTISCPDWIQEESIQSFPLEPYRKVHKFRVSGNSGDSFRRAELVFTNAEGKSLSVTVSQLKPYLTITENQLLIPASGGSSRLGLSASVNWMASCDASWCNIFPDNGSGDATLAVIASPNTNIEARSAEVTVVSEDGRFKQSFTVVQGGAGETQTEVEGDWTTLPFYHQSLVMRLTATWCGWCPMMYESIKRAQQLFPDRIQHAAIHGENSKLEFSQAYVFQDLYSTGAFPTGFVDGRIQIHNGDTEIGNVDAAAMLFVNAAAETQVTYGTKTGMQVASSVTGRTVNMDVDVYLKEAGNYKLSVFLLEDNIDEEQNGAEGGYTNHYDHDDVIRMAVTDVLGDPFRVTEDLSVKSFSYTVTVPQAYVLGNLRILVYVQAAFGDQPRIQSGNYGDYYVDNCATVRVGDKLPLKLEGSGGSSSGGQSGGNEGITPGDDIIM